MPENTPTQCLECGRELPSHAEGCSRRGCGTGLEAAAGIEQQIREELRQRGKIAAIKLCRRLLGSDLKDSKDYVDALEKGGSPSPPAKATSGAGKSGGCFWIFVAVLALVLSAAIYFGTRPAGG
jgi:hypothetical protein